MSEIVSLKSDSARSASPAWAGDRAAASADAQLIEACSAARAAVRAFDEAARRGEPFSALCELSLGEHRAVRAAAQARSSTPRGIAEKALLLDCCFNAVELTDVSQDTVDVAISLAADAVALAKAMSARAPRRLRRPVE